MKVHSTSDIFLDNLKEPASALPSEWNVEVVDEQMFFKSMDVPSWVSIVAEAPWWVQFLAASASVYFSGIISEAGKDTWKNRENIAKTIRQTPSAIARLAEFIVIAQSVGNSKTFVILAIPFPNEHSSVSLKLEYSSALELEFLIALFVRHIPELEALWKKENIFPNDIVSGMQLEFGDDCSLLVSWMDRQSLSRHERVLCFPQHFKN
ncbi:hypothetical protein ACO0LM_22225 [Undibacterium sp. Di26W]|uniref:hypothetical protein n=1 Tax=Undibacterium sp. Di26W TaxID=3413035 RepID=UPI003BF2F899